MYKFNIKNVQQLNKDDKNNKYKNYFFKIS